MTVSNRRTDFKSIGRGEDRHMKEDVRSKSFLGKIQSNRSWEKETIV